MTNNLRSNISRAKGLGSAHAGLHHWLMQRITALIMTFSVVWVFYISYSLKHKSMIEVITTIQQPENIIPLAIFSMVGLYHGALGIQVVIEDYVPNLCIRNTLILITKIFTFITIVSSICALIYLMVL